MDIFYLRVLTLPIRDLQRSAAFYKALGFKVYMESTNDSFVGVRGGAADLMLEVQLSGGPRPTSTSFTILTSDPVALYEHALREGLTPDTDEQHRDAIPIIGFSICDPDGHRIKFIAPLSLTPEVELIEHLMKYLATESEKRSGK